MAQKLSDLGIDVIVGCHPHVVQPVTVIESEVSGKSTLCVYSMGNAVSNQRIAQMDDIKTGHTEDGMFVTFTFTKYSDGSVRVTGGGDPAYLGASLHPGWAKGVPDRSPG